LTNYRIAKIHTYIIEEIRRKNIEMKKTSWKVTLCWVKSHAEIMVNDLADTLAKKGETSESLTEGCERAPKSVVKRELEEESARKW